MARLKSLTREFETFAECHKFCDKITSACYSSSQLNEYRAEKFKAAFLANPNPRFDYSAFRALLEGTSIVCVRTKEPPRILDFGGGFGEGALYIASLFGAQDYVVCETPQVAGIAKRERFDHAFFISDPGEAASRDLPLNIFFTSGAIQYTEYPMHAVRTALTPRIHDLAIFTTNNFHEHKRNFVSQISFLSWNGIGEHIGRYGNPLIAYPRKYIGETELKRTVADCGYRLLREGAATIFEPATGAYRKDLIFERVE